MRVYKALKKQEFKKGNYSLTPLRHEDRFTIMDWRNEQIYHLRQSEPLTEQAQNVYFENIVASLFEQEKPDQLLFSFLNKNKLVAYGGLVHINWTDRNAEVSFVMNTSLEKEGFSKNWSEYLYLIEQVAFKELSFRKLYVYAFDLRPHLYSTLEANSYFLDARLKDHCFVDNEFKDVVIYSKLNE